MRVGPCCGRPPVGSPRAGAMDNPDEAGSRSTGTNSMSLVSVSVEEVSKSRSLESLLLEEPLSFLQALLIVLATFFPCVALVSFFSDIGIGLQLYSYMAHPSISRAGDYVLGGWYCWLCFLFIIDFHRLHPCLRSPLGLATVLMPLVVAIFKGITYPWMGMMLLLLLGPAALGVLRTHCCRRVKRAVFYGLVGVSHLACGLTVLATWLIWMFAYDGKWGPATTARLIAGTSAVYLHVSAEQALVYSEHCEPGGSGLKGLSGDALASIQASCNAAQTVWFVVWWAPLVGIAADAVIAIFCTMVAQVVPNSGRPHIARILRQSFLFLVALFSGMYCSLYASGVSVQLASAFMGFFAAAAMALLLWVQLEVPAGTLAQVAWTSKFVEYLVRAWRSNWVRAIVVGGVGIIVPVVAILDMLRQAMRRLRGKSLSKTWYTEAGDQAMREFRAWSWCSVLVKVNLLGELAFVLNVGTKVTFVFFSWLNEQLAGVAFGLLLALVSGVGFGMFLLPPVPGSAVYMFSGIVIGMQAQQDESIGFWLGVVIAVVVGIVVKLCACIGQYMIGYFLGRSVKVQQFIGVDKVPVRALERILMQKGLKIGKVAILVGGPDWPTSVICGILRLNIPQMLLGTLPVGMVSTAPQTLMGALLTKDSGGSDSMLDMVKATATATSVIGQIGAALTAAYVTAQVVERDGEELAQPRPEHAAVAQLTAMEEAYVNAFAHVTTWPRMSYWRQAIIILAACLQLVAFYTFSLDYILSKKVCFRSFSIPNRISDPYELHGLQGNVANILVCPFGSGAVLLFAIAVALHLIHSTGMRRLARRHLAQVPQEDKGQFTGAVTPVIAVTPMNTNTSSPTAKLELQDLDHEDASSISFVSSNLPGKLV